MRQPQTDEKQRLTCDMSERRSSKKDLPGSSISSKSSKVSFEKSDDNVGISRGNHDQDSLTRKSGIVTSMPSDAGKKAVTKKLRHLPFKVPSTKNEVTSRGTKDGVESSESSSTATNRPKQAPIILPKEQFQILQDRIKNEIQNLKFLESNIECDTKEGAAAADVEDDEDYDLAELGSDIQFLPKAERDRLMHKQTLKSKVDESKTLKTKVNTILALESDADILTIDLTKESTPPVEVSAKTDENEYDSLSLELDYGAKIDWDENRKIEKMKHSPVVNLDIDESKLTSETSKKISDIKNKIGRSLSIGLTNKEVTTNSEKKESNVEDNGDEDAEILELSKLRCTSERTEVVTDRERRRKRRCANYPGFAFGSSIFSSDTMMKFSIIRNELHNIMNTQLKRVCIISYYGV